MADDQIQPDRPVRPSRQLDDEEEFDRPRRRRYRDDDEEDEDLDEIRRHRRRYRDDADDHDSGLNTLIPYKNPQALTGYYVGIFSLVPCFGLLLGPAALILGILALRYRQQRPSAGGLAHAIVALVLGSLTTLGNWGILLTVMVLPLLR